MHYIKNNSGLLFVLLIGAFLGILSAFGHTYLPRDYNEISMSYSIWLASAFVAGLFALNKRHTETADIGVMGTWQSGENVEVNVYKLSDNQGHSAWLIDLSETQ